LAPSLFILKKRAHIPAEKNVEGGGDKAGFKLPRGQKKGKKEAREGRNSKEFEKVDRGQLAGKTHSVESQGPKASLKIVKDVWAPGVPKV